MSNQVFNEGPTTSQHIDSKNDDHFEKTTFKLKRTQSMGLLDNFITSSASTDADKNTDSDVYMNTVSNSNRMSADTDPIPAKCPANKITSRSFVSNDTLNKLNLNSGSSNSNSYNNSYSCGNTPNTYLHSRSNSNTNPYSHSSSGLSSNANSYPHSNPNHTNNKNKHCINSPSSFQSDDFFDDLYNSEDSLSSTGSVNLTPKHQLKKFQLLNQYNDLDYNNNNGNDLINCTNNNNNNQDINHLLHDDIDIKDSPKQHVDYLSHKWDEEEISKSWKYVILKKNDVAESARLENASWRTWAQTRNRLKTISPEELNWSKDNDVTWLYGPVFNNSNNSINSSNDNNKNKNKNLNSFSIMKRSSFDNSNNSFLNNSNSDHLKSILKKKSNVEKMISDASYCRLQHLLENHEQKLKSSPILESTTSDNLNSNLNLNSSSLTTISSLKSDSTLNSSNSNNFLSSSSTIKNTNDDKINSISSIDNTTLNKLKINTGLKKSLLKNSQLHIQQNKDLNKIEKKTKHIHFNMRVDQCISVDYPRNFDIEDNSSQTKLHYLYENELDADDENEIEEIEDYDDDYDDDDDDDDDDNDGFVLNPTVSCPNISHRPPILSHNNSINSISDDINTIAPLPATTLKTCSDDEDDRMYTVSHNTKTNRGYDYYYDYNTVYSNSSNPMMYSVVSNNNEDVEMFDVPENCKIEDDDMDIDNNEIDLDLNLGPNNNIKNNVNNDSFEVVDVPTNFKNDLPQFDNNINDIDDEYEVQHIEYEHNNNESISDQNLKRTPSIGTSSSSNINSNINSISSQSLSTIKVGLSGLDLSSSGLKRSTGSGSKPQLYQLNHQNLNNNSSNSILSSRNNSLTSKKTFMFNNSDSNSDSDSNSGDDEQKNDDQFGNNNQLNFNILGSASATSLSDINKTLSSSNGNLSNLNMGFNNNNNNTGNSFKFNNINMGNDNINSDTDTESNSDQDIMIIPNRNRLISSSNTINSNLKQ